MEYWSVEVKPGETVKVDPEDTYVHLSQVCRREAKKPEDVQLFVKINGKKEEFGTLNQGKYQIKYDVVFEKEFELTNASKNTSVFFRGYKVEMDDGDNAPHMYDMSDEDSEEEDEEEAPKAIKLITENGKPKLVEEKKPKKASKEGPKEAAKAKKEEAKPMEIEEDDDSSDEEGSDDEDDSDNEDPMKKVQDDEDDSDDEEEDESDDDEDDSDEEEEEATPEKVEVGKKRGKDQKTPAQEKKAKFASPAAAQKTEGKKGAHVATPHPAKTASKTPAAASNDKNKTPKSAGSVACKSCTKTFNSETALQSHTKAKHA